MDDDDNDDVLLLLMCFLLASAGLRRILSAFLSLLLSLSSISWFGWGCVLEDVGVGVGAGAGVGVLIVVEDEDDVEGFMFLVC